MMIRGVSILFLNTKKAIEWYERVKAKSNIYALEL